MKLADFHATYITLRDDDIATVYCDDENGITGAMSRPSIIQRSELVEIRAASWADSDIATAERRAYAVLAMCEWMKRVQKGEV